jgi:hypothetical protein
VSVSCEWDCGGTDEVRGGLGESNIGYCSAQNKDALGMKGVRAQSKDPQDEKRNKDGQAMT